MTAAPSLLQRLMRVSLVTQIVIGLIAGIVFFALGKLDAAQWLSQSAWVLGLYMAGNVGDSAVTK